MKPATNHTPFFQQAAAMLLFFVLLFFVLQYGASIFIPLTFSFLLAFIALPLSIYLEKMKMPRWLSAFLGIAVIGLLICSILILLGYQLTGLLEDIPIFKTKLSDKIATFQKYIRSNWGITVSQQNSWIDKQMADSSTNFTAYIMDIFSMTTTLVVNAFLVPILAFFILIYRERFKNFLKLVDEKYHYHAFFIIGEVGKVTQAYLKGIMIDTLILAVLNALGFWYYGLEYALLFAVLAAVLNIVPYIGGLVGSLIPVFMALVTMDNMWSVAGVLGVGLVVQFLDNNFIGPKVIGSSVSVNPLFSTLALLVGALVWGISGMLLSIPLAGMLKVVFDNIPFLQPYGFLMGEEDTFKKRPFTVNIGRIPYLNNTVNDKKV